MKEAFEKIRKRIEEITISRNIYGSICGCNMGKCEDDDCLKCLKKKIFSIVSEVEAEYINKSTGHINKSSYCSTNADKIRSMSDSELAEFLAETELHGSQGSYKDYLDWLKSTTTD